MNLPIASSDTLPPLTDLQQLLHAVSIECRPNESNSSSDTTATSSSSFVPLVRSVSHKLELQQRLKAHAQQRQQESSATHTQQQEQEANGSDSAESPTPLMRQLSLAAESGMISHDFKVEIKNMLLNGNSAHQSKVTLAPTKLVRGVSETGESIVSEEKIDLSHIDPAVCAQLQQEERDALTAIYEELVSFEAITRAIDAKGNITETKSRDEVEAKEEEKEESKQDDWDAAEPLGEPVETQQCQSVTVTIKPYPASGSERNLVSTRVRFILPPLYPYLRPSFKLLTCEGEMNSADGMMCSTAIQDAMNEIYQEKEPMDESEVRVVLFELINAVQKYLIDYITFLEDQEYRAKLAVEEAEKVAAAAERERQHKLELKRLRQEAEIKHAAAVLAYQSSNHAKLEWSQQNQHDADSSTALSQYERKQRMSAEELEQLKRQEEQKALEDFAKESDRLTAAVASYECPPNPSPSLGNFSSLLPSPHQVMVYISKNDQWFNDDYRTEFREKRLFLKYLPSEFLIYRFLQKRMEYGKKGISTRVDIGFHGTVEKNVESIEKNGLALVGETVGDEKKGTAVKVTHSTCLVGLYGSGIYLASRASLSLRYGSINELFVCLALRGRTKAVTGKMKKSASAESHTDPNGREWIIFDPECILPIYLFTNVDPATTSSSSSKSKSKSKTKTKKQSQASAASSASSASAASTASSSSRQ